MEFIIISVIALLMGISSGIVLSQQCTKSSRIMLWGVISVFLLSWSPATLAGGIYTAILGDPTAIWPFWLYGVPSFVIVGIIIFFTGVVLKVKQFWQLY